MGPVAIPGGILPPPADIPVGGMAAPPLLAGGMMGTASPYSLIVIPPPLPPPQVPPLIPPPSPLGVPIGAPLVS